MFKDRIHSVIIYIFLFCPIITFIPKLGFFNSQIDIITNDIKLENFTSQQDLKISSYQIKNETVNTNET
ncbi:MAG: hypothetical protein ACFFCM_18725, partial [Promethearchaeota archaeon]